MRKILFELILLGIGVGLAVEVIKPAIPYLPLIWLVLCAHFTWELITKESVLSYALGLKKAVPTRYTVIAYFLIAIGGAALLCLYWWGLSSFFRPRIAAYEAEQRTKGHTDSKESQAPANLGETKPPPGTGEPQAQQLAALTASIQQLRQEIATLSQRNNSSELENVTDQRLSEMADSLASRLQEFAELWREQIEVNIGESYFSKIIELPEGSPPEQKLKFQAEESKAKAAATKEYIQKGSEIIKLANDVQREALRRLPYWMKPLEQDRTAAIFFQRALKGHYDYYELHPIVEYMRSLAPRIAHPPGALHQKFNWHKEWTKMEADFRRIDDPRIFAECAPDYRGEQDVWQIRGETENTDTQECRSLCELAGSALDRSYPEIPMSEIVRLQTQHWVRWLCYLRETEPEQFSLHKYHMAIKGKTITRDGGVIEQLTEVSANACKKCRAATYPTTRPS